MCGRLVVKTLKKILREGGRGRTIFDFAIDYVVRYNLVPINQVVNVQTDADGWQAKLR